MRAVVQRVSEASVTSAPDRDAEARETGRIGAGIVALIGVTHDDTADQAHRLADKVYDLRIFPDRDGAMNLSCADVGGGVLVVSQFTLYGDTRKGRRPSFVAAAAPEVAEPLVDEVVARLEERGAQVAAGVFRTHMQISLVNDGPVTVIVDV